MGIGHSARDTYHMLYQQGIHMERKDFAVGVRIEHTQDLIDHSQYGCSAADLGLDAADYALVYHDKENGRSCYSFCMCPGGVVVAAASEEGGVVTNGMSLYKRDSGIANSALVVNVTADDVGSSSPLAGIEFQRRYENWPMKPVAGLTRHRHRRWDRSWGGTIRGRCRLLHPTGPVSSGPICVASCLAL